MKRTWKLTGEQKAEIAQLYAAGEKVDAIAAAYAVWNRTVTQIARARGLPPRRPSRSRDASAS